MTQFEIDVLAVRPDMRASPAGENEVKAMGVGRHGAMRAAWPFLVRTAAPADLSPLCKPGAAILSDLQVEAGMAFAGKQDRKENS